MTTPAALGNRHSQRQKAIKESDRWHAWHMRRTLVEDRLLIMLPAR